MSVKNAGIASPGYLQLISATFRIMRHPQMMRAPPVAYGGIEAKIGEKNTEARNQNEQDIAVIPVLPPSEIPVYSVAQ